MGKRRIKVKLILRDGVSPELVAQQIRTATLEFWADDEAEFGITVIEADEDSITVGRGKRYSSRGRPRKDALRTYIKTLVMIYENATGKRVGRTYDAYSGEELLHPFIAACLHGAGKGYPRGGRSILSEVLRELHPNAKRGRPKTGS